MSSVHPDPVPDPALIPVPPPSPAPPSSSSAASKASLLPACSEPSSFYCPLEACRHHVATFNGLDLHIKTIHPNQASSLLTLAGIQKKDRPPDPVRCDVCGKTYTSRRGCMQHKQRQHADQYQGRKTFECAHCDAAFAFAARLIDHMRKEHPETLTNEVFRVLYLRSKDDFQAWVEGEEERTYVSFIREKWKRVERKETWGDEVNVDVVRQTVWKCSATRAPPPPPRQRKNRKKESKCVGHCAARVSVSLARDGRARVEQFREHTHELHVKHARLSTRVREQISLFLTQGMGTREIVCLCKSMHPPDSRSHFVSEGDVRNIRRKMNPRRLAECDIESVRKGAEVMNAGEDEPYVRFLKLQGDHAPHIVRHSTARHTWDPESTVAVYQSPWQREMLQSYGKDFVGIDSTHSKAGEDHHLFSLVVRDAHDCGVVVGHCITNKGNGDEISYFLRVTAVAHGVTPRVIVTDDDAAVIAAVVNVFNDGTRHLLCTFHTKKALYTYLTEAATTLPAGLDMYHQMAILLDTREQPDFEQGWRAFCRAFHDTEPDAIDHLAAQYYARKETCAFAFRALDDAAADGVLGSFHKRFKQGPLGSKTWTRIDQHLRVLHEYVGSERRRWFHRESLSHVALVQQHAVQRTLGAGMDVLAEDVLCVHEHLFQVKSRSEDNKLYNVRPREDVGECRACTAQPCIHRWQCTCIAFHTGRARCCKHTAAVHFATGGTDGSCRPLPTAKENSKRFVARRTAADTAQKDLQELFAEMQRLQESAKRLRFAPPEVSKALARAREIIDTAVTWQTTEPQARAFAAPPPASSPCKPMAKTERKPASARPVSTSAPASHAQAPPTASCSTSNGVLESSSSAHSSLLPPAAASSSSAPSSSLPTTSSSASLRNDGANAPASKAPKTTTSTTTTATSSNNNAQTTHARPERRREASLQEALGNATTHPTEALPHGGLRDMRCPVSNQARQQRQPSASRELIAQRENSSHLPAAHSPSSPLPSFVVSSLQETRGDMTRNAPRST